jgi:CheY-like chemotaxis protein
MNPQLKSVFLIDDDEATHFIHRLTMERSGLVKDITPFSDAEKAFQQLKAMEDGNAAYPDLILLDLNMPGYDGWDFLEDFQHLPFPSTSRLAILSTSINPEDQSRAKTWTRVCEFLIKPLKIQSFKDFMERQFPNSSST